MDVLSARFADIDLAPAPLLAQADKSKEQWCVHVPANRLMDVMSFLHDDALCRFEQVSDLTCVDYLDFPKARDRYGVIYALLSVSMNHRIWVKCFVNDPDPEVPSVVGIWNGANWLEREVFDLFGIKFADHPDLRRILTWDGFDAHPLRKDYPLHGQGERVDFKVVERDSA